MPVENYTLKIVAAERNSTSPSYYPYVLVNNVQVGRLDFSSINKATWNEFTFNVNLDPTVSYLELKIQVNRFTITGYYIDNVKLFHENDSTTNLIFNPGMYVDNSEFLSGIWANWNVQYGEWYFGTNIGLFNVTTFANDNLRDGDNYQLYLARTGHIKQTLNITRNSIEQSDNPNTFDVDLSFSNPFSTEPVKSANYTFSTSNQSPLSTYVYTNYLEQYKLLFNARSRLNTSPTTEIYYSTTNIFDTSSLVLLGTVSPTNTDTTVFSYDISLSPTTEYFSIHFKNNSDALTHDGNCFYNIQLIAFDPTTGLTTGTNLIADSDMKLGSGGLNDGEWYRLYNIYNESWHVYSAIHEKNSTRTGTTINASGIGVNAGTETVCIIGSGGSLIQELAINRTYDTVTDTITTTFTNKITNQNSNSYSYTQDLDNPDEYTYRSSVNFITFGGSSTGDTSYLLQHPSYGNTNVIGDILTQDISASSTPYTLVATKLGDTIYNDISATDTFTVQKINQSPITITNDISYVYSENQIIDITTTGGSINDDIVITINGVADTQLVNPDVDTYTIVASSAGNINYNPVSDSIDIEIKQTYQDLLQFTTQPQYVYSPDQTINLTTTGGSGDGEITFNVTTTNGSLGTITELTNPDVDEYTIEAIKQESNNYFSTTSTTLITIIKATQDQLVNETTTEFTYSPELVIDLSASGGSTNNPIVFTLDGTETTQLISPSIGNYSIVATKLGNQNYEDVLLNFSVNVTKSTQDSLSLSPSIVFYELLSGTVRLTITGGLDTIDPIVTTTSKFITIDGTILTYTRPEIVTLHVTKPGTENYSDVSGDFRFEIVKSMDHLRNTLHTRPRDLFNDPNITTNDILNYYTVEELLDNNITNVLVPDPRNGFSVRELLDMGIGACAIYNTGKIRLIDLQRAGYKVKVCLH